MKKVLLALMLAMMLALVGCGSSGGSDQPTDETDTIVDEVEEVQDVDSILDCLGDSGFKKTDNGYELNIKEDGVDSNYVITAEGNTITLKGVMDFGSDNSMMIDSIKSEPDSILSIPSDYLIELANQSGHEDAVMNYEFYVKDTKVSEGTMTVKQAFEIASDIDD